MGATNVIFDTETDLRAKNISNCTSVRRDESQQKGYAHLTPSLLFFLFLENDTIADGCLFCVICTNKA